MQFDLTDEDIHRLNLAAFNAPGIQKLVERIEAAKAAPRFPTLIPFDTTLKINDAAEINIWRKSGYATYAGFAEVRVHTTFPPNQVGLGIAADAHTAHLYLAVAEVDELIRALAQARVLASSQPAVPTRIS